MKRVLSIILAMIMVIGICLSTAGAAEGRGPMPRGSLYISGYNASMKEGTAPGSVKISYTITSSKEATSIGVKK